MSQSQEDYTDMQATALIDQIVAAVADPRLSALPPFDDMMAQAEKHFSPEQWTRLEKEVEALE